MFNEMQKERFLVSYGSATITSIFNKCAPYEEEWGKDISTFTFYEIQEMYKRWNTTSVETLKFRHSILGGYTDWCILQTLVPDSQNHFRELKLQDLQQCVNQVAADMQKISREVLLSWTEQMANPRDQFAFLALFEGVFNTKYEDLLNAKVSDICGNTIKLSSNRVIEISDKLIQYAYEADNELYSYSEAGRRTKAYSEDDEYIIKCRLNANRDNENKNYKRLMNRIFSKNLGITNMPKLLSGPTLSTAGQIHWILTRSQELNITPKEYIQHYEEEFKNQYGLNYRHWSVHYNKLERYLV